MKKNYIVAKRPKKHDNIEEVQVMLCLILSETTGKITSSELYDIAISTELIDYFSFTDAFSFLCESGSVIADNDVLKLTPKGIQCAERLKFLLNIFQRERCLRETVKYFAQKSNAKNAETSCTENKDGSFAVNFSCSDGERELIRLEVYAPNSTQAELIANSLMKNPAEFYKNVIEYALKA